MEYFSVQQAAKSLGVSEVQVGRLISQGDLIASRFGRSWMIDPRSVNRYADLHPSRGRPLPPSRAWELLKSSSVSSLEEARELAVHCRRRAERREVRVLLGLLDRVREDSRVVLSGVDAARHFGAAVSVMPPLDFYIRRGDFQSFSKDFVVHQDFAEFNCVVRIVDVPMFVDTPMGNHVPLLVALVDLIAEGDYRSAKEAFRCLEVPHDKQQGKSSIRSS